MMKKNLYQSMLILAGLTAFSAGSYAQNQTSSGVVIPVKNGSVAMNLEGKGLKKNDVAAKLCAMLGLSAKHTFSPVSETTDKLGFTHIGYQQYYNGILVEEGKLLAHFKEGTARSINGRIVPLGNLAVSPSLQQETAISTAARAADVTKTFRQYPVQLVITTVTSGKLKEYSLAYKVRIDGRNTQKKVVMLNVYIDAQSGKVLKQVSLMAHNDVNGTANTLYSGSRTIVMDSLAEGFRLRDNGRKVETYDGGGVDMDANGFFLEDRDYWNNSTNWDLFNTFSSTVLQTANSSLFTGVGQFSAVLFGLAKSTTPTFDSLIESPRFVNASSSSNLPATNSGFYTILNQSMPYTGFYVNYDFSMDMITDTVSFPIVNPTPGTYPWNDGSGGSGEYTIGLNKNPALDAHWGMERTHDFYNTIFNRNSYDNAGSTVKNYVNAGDQYNASASPDPYNFMMYGMGDGDYMDPLVGLDIMGHEFTHMVTEHNGNGGLEYQGESGALNESFSDIFGTCIEFFAKGTDANWTMGETVMLAAPGFFRSMANPKLAENPDTYEGDYWIDPSSPNDNGGVHYNSGVQNKWFYLLCQGGTGTNDKNDAYTVNGIGIEKAQQIAYRNLTQYITPSSQYIDAYNGSLQAAADLYSGTSSAEYKAVKDAWYAVGIGEKDTVTGVGNIEIGANDLKLYPNPASARVTIASSIAQDLDAQIINVVGIPVKTIRISKGLNPVDISMLSKGVYMIRYNTGSKGYVQKLTVL